ncbi:MAG: hypothetical protein JST82_13100 [Bacteroidetes bacterium]|nr:hypothetical protein [Bacteroidota bacterium]
MKYCIVLSVFVLLFAQCKTPNDVLPNVEPTGYYDTLGIHWTAVEKNNIIYYFHDFNSQSSFAAQYIDEHESAYVTINNVFNAKMPRKLRFFIWGDTALANQLLGHPLGFTTPTQCACYVMPGQTVGHEMTHAITYWGGGVPSIEYRRFINEGVAVAFDLSGRDRISMAKKAAAGQGISSIVELWDGNKQNISEEVFYPIAGAFMDYLNKLNESDKFYALVKDQSLQSAQNIYGKDRMDALIAGFNSQIGL